MPSRHKHTLVRERITYPKTKPTPDTDPCRDKSLQCEHLLHCGHLITTPKPDEPCAPNCHSTAAPQTMNTIQETSLQASMSLEFYCDACVEIAIEPQIAVVLSSEEAEIERATLREKEAVNRNKANKYRRHPFDTAIPRTGDNVFEDIELSPALAVNSSGPFRAQPALSGVSRPLQPSKKRKRQTKDTPESAIISRPAKEPQSTSRILDSVHGDKSMGNTSTISSSAKGKRCRMTGASTMPQIASKLPKKSSKRVYFKL